MLYASCLSLDCYNETLYTRWLKEQIFISQSSGVLDFQDQDAGRFGSLNIGLCFQLVEGCLLSVSLHGGRGSSGVSFSSYKDTNLIIGGPVFIIQLMTSLTNSTILRDKVLAYEFWGSFHQFCPGPSKFISFSYTKDTNSISTTLKVSIGNGITS